MTTDAADAETGRGPTAAHVLGEVAWLMAQSPLHQAMPLAVIGWMVMPALSIRQFFLFRDGDRPVGVAFWAFCSPDVEAKLQAGAFEPSTRLLPEDWNSGDRLWLVDIVAPFATAENRHVELMIADLIAGPLAGKDLNLHRTDPATGERTVVTVGPETIEQLKQALGRTAG